MVISLFVHQRSSHIQITIAPTGRAHKQDDVITEDVSTRICDRQAPDV